MALSPELINKLRRLLDRKLEIENALTDLAMSSNAEFLKDFGRELSELQVPTSLFTQYLEAETGLGKMLSDLAAEKDAEMIALYEDEMAALREKIQALENDIHNFLSGGDEELNKPLIIEIRSGTGGEEAALFAGDLFRMYSRYCEIKGWKSEPISSSPSARGGFKEVVFAVKGNDSYSLLRYESGVHRVQRIPITETNGRIHTSAATVAVLLEPDEVDVEIDPGDIKTDTFRASGAGGQHVNKTSSAIRLTHLPSGIVVECQDERSQHQNKAKALRLLRARLLEKMTNEQQEKISQDRRSQVGSGDRSQKVRTFNFPQNRVTDHRAGITVHRLDAMMEGDMTPLLEPLATFMKTAAMEADEEPRQ